MDNQTLKAIEEARGKLTPILKNWRARISFSTTIRMERRTEDTSIDGCNETIPGTISMVTEPVEYLRISIWQREENEWILEAPSFPNVEVRNPSYGVIELYADIIAERYKDGPTEEKWAEEEAKMKQQLKGKQESAIPNDEYLEYLA